MQTPLISRSVPAHMRSPAIATKCEPSNQPRYSPSSVVRKPNGPGRVSTASSSAAGACCAVSGSASGNVQAFGRGASHTIGCIV